MPRSRRTSILALGAAAVAAGCGAALLVLGPVGADGAALPLTTSTEAPASSTTSTEAPTTTAPTTTTTAATPTTTVPPADDGTLRQGSSGPEVAALQQRLLDLGFWLDAASGSYGRTTQQAVMAFQKANGLSRDGTAGPVTLAAVAGASRPQARQAADGIEIDLARQLLLIVQGGQVLWAINTSTGTSATPTPPGDFAIDRQIDGMRHAPLGDLYRPKYFNGGIAIHGSGSVPGHPASHGCARVSNAAIGFLWSSGLAPIGTPVRVY